MAGLCSCMSLRTQGILVGILSVLLYNLGLFDWPTFHEQSSIIPFEGNSGTKSGKGNDTPLYALMVTSTQSDIGNHIGRLVQGTNELIRKSNIEIVEQVVLPASEENEEKKKTTTTTTSVSINTTKALNRAARLYGAPLSTDSVGVGLYFDDPSKVKNPKWAVGWLVHVKNYEQLLEIAKQLNEQKDVVFGSEENTQKILPETIKGVRIGGHGGIILKARIPWRTILTPMIAPLLHWNRGMKKYNREYKSDLDYKNDAVACEMYVGSDQSSYIDYIVLMGNTQNEWYDTFPEETIE